jgi:hypothetical protein
MKIDEYKTLISKKASKPKRRNVQSEDAEKKAFIAQMRKQMPEIERLLIPLDLHALKLKPHQTANLKALGGKKGMPDYFLAKSQLIYTAIINKYLQIRPEYFGLFIEFKRPKNHLHAKGVRTKEQKEYAELFVEKGYAYVLVYTAQEAINEIKKYLGE